MDKNVIQSSGTNAIKVIMKNKENFKTIFKNKMEGKLEETFVYDVTFENYQGSLNFRMKDGEFVAGNLNLPGIRKVISMDNDANLIKLLRFVYETNPGK